MRFTKGMELYSIVKSNKMLNRHERDSISVSNKLAFCWQPFSVKISNTVKLIASNCLCFSKVVEYEYENMIVF
jgi:hypothetical protein